MRISIDERSAFAGTARDMLSCGKLKPQAFSEELTLEVSSSVRLLQNGVKTPFCIDLLSGKMRWRLMHISKKREAVAKAVIAGLNRPYVFDATAGLGRDSLILQCLGAKVTMFERNPVIWLLLSDALRRAEQERSPLFVNGLPKLMPLGSVRFHMEHGAFNKLPDVVYYDPMFPERRKSAKVKKDMRLFHDLAGDDSDTDSFFEYFLGIALHHVTVKRPASSPPLTPKQTLSLSSIVGETCRFDCYHTGIR